MLGKPDPKLKSHIFRREVDTIPYEANFPVEWKTKLMLYPFRNLNFFPLNPYNANRTIMQSKNCQELPFAHGNYLVQELIGTQNKYKVV